MRLNAAAKQALATGTQQADDLLKARRKARQTRNLALAAATPAGTRRGARGAAAARQSAGWLLAEGDSWFDYPFNDVLKVLEDAYGYEVESVAHKGDTIESMAYDGGQLDALVRRLERMLRYGQTPKAVLLSGGGNDIAGEEFSLLINHARSPVAGFNARIVDGLIDERLRTAYLTIIAAVTRVCEGILGHALPILLHGYDYPVPDGRGFAGGWGPLPGPWLEPGFRRKGFLGETAQAWQARITMLGAVMDAFNGMLGEIASLNRLPHVHFVELRRTLSSGADYKEWWANELHPTRQGFEQVAARYQDVLVTL